MILLVAEKGDIAVKLACALTGVFLSNGEELVYKHLSDSRYTGEIESLKKKLYFDSNKGFRITFTNGHMFGLKMPKVYEPRLETSGWRDEYFPVIPDDFKNLIIRKAYTVNERQERRAKAVLDLMREADLIINATDADREGQCIFDIPYVISGSRAKVMRLWVSDQTQEKFKTALNRLEDNKIYENLFHAGLCRSLADWLVGMNLTGVYASHNRRMIHIGRVKTPTLAIIAEREREIRNFKPEKHYPLVATFRKNNTEFSGEIDVESLGMTRLADRSVSISIAKEIGNETVGKVLDLQEEKENNLPPLLYSNASLMGDAGEYFGYTMQETERVLQDLYEKHDLISYPRTDSNVIPSSLENELVDIFNNLNGIQSYQKFNLNYFRPSSRYINDKSMEGKSHYAIIPTKKVVDFNKLNEQEKNVYHLIALRFLCMFAKSNISNKTRARIAVGRYLFISNGKVVLEPGWTKMYDIQLKDLVLPFLSVNELVSLTDMNMHERETKPPKPYTIKTLGSILENVSRLVVEKEFKEILNRVEGIGTPATRTSIISELAQGNYISQNKQIIRCTDNGLDAIENLKKTSIENLYSPIMTAEWEIKLKSVEEGKMKAYDFMGQIINFVDSSCLRIKSMGAIPSSFSRQSSNINPIKSGGNVSVKQLSGDGATKGRTKMGDCGFCSGAIKAYDKLYKCPNCGALIWKNALGYRNLPEIPEKMALKLLAKQKVKTELISRQGNPYKVILSYNKDAGKIDVALDV